MQFFNWFSNKALISWLQGYKVSRPVISKFSRYLKSSFFFLVHHILSHDLVPFGLRNSIEDVIKD